MAFEDLHTKYVGQEIDLPPAADLVAMLDDGETYESLAETFDCSAATIRLRVNRSGLRTTKPTALASTPGAVTDVEGDGSPSSPSTSLLPLTHVGNTDWMRYRLCDQTDPEMFFPDKGGSTREAKAICARCTVQAECLDYAIDNDERFGIWGGVSERDRRRIRKAIQAEAGVPDTDLPCADCERTFANVQALGKHRAATHDSGPAESHPCPHCDYVSHRRQGLAVHITKIHADLRNAS